MKTSHLGFSFIECLFVLSLVTILVLIANPLLNKQLANYRKNSAAHQLLILLSYSRAEAVSKGKTITFCASVDGALCSTGSTQKLIVFMDKNNNQSAESDELLRSETPDIASATYFTQASAHRTYFRFRSEGTAKESGSITMCPEGNESDQAVQLIINFGGRARVAVDTNQDGIPEDSDGNPVDCHALAS